MNAVVHRPFAADTVDPSTVRALVVDENAASRTAVKGLLQSLGIEQVQQAGDPVRAIRLMELEAFSLVMCEAQFRAQMDGSQVLEFVRTRRLLSPSAAFILMSGEAQRSLVASAREWQPDGFVLKPLTAAALGPRIDQALNRRRLYAPLFEAADRNDPQKVLQHARELGQQTGGASLELLRWQAKALIDLGRYAQVREVCDRALELRNDVPWADVGLAHWERGEGRFEEAIHRLRSTVRAHPSCSEAYDLLVDMLQEQGQVARAMTVARQALEQLSTTQRLRTLGEIAYAQGELEVAEECYTELIRRTSTSLTRTALDTGMLGQVFVTRGASDKALRVVASVEDDPDGPSRALVAAVQAQAHSARGDPRSSEAAARRALAITAATQQPENVLLLVAQGAFAAGLPDEARRVAERALAQRKHATGPGALARKVLTDAGFEPETFARAVTGKAPFAEALIGGLMGATPAAPATPPEPAPAAPTSASIPMPAASATPSGRDGGPPRMAGTSKRTPLATKPYGHAGAANAGDDEPMTSTTASEDVAHALEALHKARFDDAWNHVSRARRKLPANPMVLMAAVQVQMLKMRAQGFDDESAQDVRRCLAALDKQIPGDERVFPVIEPAAPAPTA
jgi:tetratricopeptide (TPR) repeat protein